MKVYVDELPKSCEECPCCSEQDFAIYSEYCEVLNEYVSEMVESKQELKPKTCPLQSLSDYTKQVRKEVCEIIWGGFVGLNNINGNYEYKKFEDAFRKFLDQIEQGETK